MTSESEPRLRSIAMGPARIDLLRKLPSQHKYDHGHALVMSGSAGRTGAARLAARAALRIGAGLVTIGVPSEALGEVAAQVTAVMVRVAEPLEDVLADRRINALCIGPGYGPGAACRAAVAQCLTAERAVVLDADALTSFADDPEALFAMTRGRAVVMTPHGGEFRRLFPDLSGDAAGVAEAAARAGCVVLLKGDCTMVGRDGVVARHNADGRRAAPWLATAGSGDVLAGLITGLLARGLDAAEAAECAVWLHAEAARCFGPGLIAEDLAEEIPAVFRTLGV
ncbi:NAD(P)H-hydrate dehydratase [Pseudooceanicola sp.]|uniref:NAD(P)H-hydrate dehydratase n=1 Tax=Pseudooceanicola sp. TaxID=1914328 RepID=UPI0035C68739